MCQSIDLTEYYKLCDLQFKREIALREYVINPTKENKLEVNRLGDIINNMLEKTLEELFG